MSVNSLKRPAAFHKFLPAAAVLVAVAAFDQPVAYAGNGFLGGFVGGVVGGVVGGAIGHMFVEPRYRYAPSLSLRRPGSCTFPQCRRRRSRTGRPAFAGRIRRARWLRLRRRPASRNRRC